MKRTLVLAVVMFFGAGCTSSFIPSTSMKLSSSAFTQNELIPAVYTCDGQNVNPELRIEGVPSNAKSLALIMDDPDAPIGTFVHWVAFNIPVSTTSIAQGSEPQGAIGNNGRGKSGYTGPCPPDREHRYFFKLYALDTRLDLPAGASKADVEHAMQGHIIEFAELLGRYDRKR